MESSAVAAVMRRQCGVVSRAQALSAGLTDRQIQRLVTVGRWTRLLPGVYLSDDVNLSWRTRAHAALLAAGHGAVLVGSSAATLREQVPERLPITVAIPAHRRCHWRARSIKVLRLDVAHHECVTVQGLRTTTRLRTAVDVAHLMPLAAAQAVLDRMLVLDHISLDELTAAVTASNRTGSAQARRLVESANDMAAAESERLARRLFREAGITGWEANHRTDSRSGSIKVDLRLRRYRIVVEVKGWVFHSKSDRAMSDDKRVSDLSIAGWIVIPVGYLELVSNPAEVVARVRAAIAAREAEAS